MLRVLLALLALAALAAHANDGCLQADTPWSCIGTVEIRSVSKGEPVRLRMVRFAGGDVLAEVEQPGIRASALAVLPSGTLLYRGIDLQDVDSPRGPFMFFNEAIGWGAFFPLHSAYPSGPASVPEGRSEKTIEIQKQTLTLVTTRAGRQRVEFSYAFGDSAARVEGSWDGEAPAALPDDFSLADWKHKRAERLGVLRDARALPPAGK